MVHDIDKYKIRHFYKDHTDIVEEINKQTKILLNYKLSQLEKEFNKGNEKENAQIKAEKGKVVANKDFDPNKEGVQSIFGTEEENAKSKDKKVFNTMEEVAKPKEMKSAKDGIKPVEVAPIQKTDAFGTSKEMGGGIGGGQKDLLGKKADLADPNRPDIQAEMEQEMEDQLSGTGTDFEDAEGLAQAFDVVKERYKNDPQRLAVVNKLENKEKFRAAAKEYLEKNSGTSPLWAKSGMTGNQKQ
jgi:hypothetical protein